ncbi:MAG: CinA family nicotinamide mononucleotide deamidase-related protein [Actinobacteria bacterium]|nr:CinA family nicotinamide mononucleotide deamidase-related protein [Actinomycetota bacterium]
MKCSIISIGTELTLGMVVNTNAQYIAENLTGLGIECNCIYTIRDKEDEIVYTLKESLKHSDIIIISGGLGPTDDDLTRSAVAKAFGTELVRLDSLDESSLRFIKKVKDEGIRERLLRQSYIPFGSIPIKPRIGSASGFIVSLKDGKKVFCIPGVPKEMRDMFDFDVVPVLKNMLGGDGQDEGGEVIRKLELLATDISETEIEEKIKDLVEFARNKGIEIGITSTPGLIKIILTSRASDFSIAQENLELIKKEIVGRLEEHIYGENSTSISEALKRTIMEKTKKITVCVAESMTGGLVCKNITDAAGSSEYFLGGIVSYSKSAKVHILGVSRKSIERFGAVSRRVCFEMAKHARELFGADFAISVTGFAGPGVDEKDKEVGLVYCCILGPNDYVRIYRKKFIGTRPEIRFRASQFIINKLRNSINNLIE